MEDIATFIDSFTMEDKLYWQIPREDQDAMFELVWDKDHASTRWALRLMSEETWVRCTSEELTDQLVDHRVDLEAAKRILGASIVTQAVYASLVVEAAEKLFGKETLQKAFADTNSFLTKILRNVKRHTDAKKKSPNKHLKLVSQKDDN